MMADYFASGSAFDRQTAIRTQFAYFIMNNELIGKIAKLNDLD